MDTSKATKKFVKLNKIIPYEKALRDFLFSSNNNIKVANSKNEISDLEFKTKLVLRIALVLRKHKSSDSPIR